MSFQTEAFVYSDFAHDKLVCGSNDRPLKTDYRGTTTIGGITYNTIKIKYREFYGPTYDDKHDYRQEWLAENLTVPLGGGRDIVYADLSSYDLQCRISVGSSAPYTVTRRSLSYPLHRSAEWWDDNFSSTSPRSLLLPTGERLYNDAAIALIDQTYKSTGWRVPCLADLNGMVRYYADDGVHGTSGRTVLGIPNILEPHSLKVYGRVDFTQGQEYPIPKWPFTRLANGSSIRFREPADKSGSELSATCYDIYSRALRWDSFLVDVVCPLGESCVIKLDYWGGSPPHYFDFLPSRDVCNIEALVSGIDSFTEVPTRLGLMFGTSTLNWSDDIPTAVAAYYFRGQNHPNFYSVRLCRAPLKP